MLLGCLPRADGEQLVGLLALLCGGESLLPVLVPELLELALVDEAQMLTGELSIPGLGLFGDLESLEAAGRFVLRTEAHESYGILFVFATVEDRHDAEGLLLAAFANVGRYTLTSALKPFEGLAHEASQRVLDDVEVGHLARPEGRDGQELLVVQIGLEQQSLVGPGSGLGPEGDSLRQIARYSISAADDAVALDHFCVAETRRFQQPAGKARSGLRPVAVACPRHQDPQTRREAPIRPVLATRCRRSRLVLSE